MGAASRDGKARAERGHGGCKARVGWRSKVLLCTGKGEGLVVVRNNKTREKRRMQMKIKLGNLRRGCAGFWCWRMGPGSVVGTWGTPRLLLA